jgi:hypothetical protein
MLAASPSAPESTIILRWPLMLIDEHFGRISALRARDDIAYTRHADGWCYL